MQSFVVVVVRVSDRFADQISQFFAFETVRKVGARTMDDHEDLSATFSVLCQHCGQALRARPEHVGMAARCPFCENVTQLEMPEDDRRQTTPVPPATDPQQDSSQSEDTQQTVTDSKHPHAGTRLPQAAEDETPTLHSGRRTSVAGSAGLESTASFTGDSTHPKKRVSVPGYEILGELGRGGMGVVYKARQISLKRKVALKMILAGAHAGGEMRRRFISEAEAVAKLQHPNIVQIHEIGHADGLPYFSLEFVSGGSLDDRLADNPPSFRESAELVRVLAEAMHYAHRQGIVHRDLKPANVLLTKEGTPKITDFGLAKALDGGGHTQDGALLGTPAYMAPEQAAGDIKAIGPATDTYALGAVLYELLTGEVPFVGTSGAAVMAMVQVAQPTPLRQLRADVPPDLETISLKCLEKDSKDRYQSAEALADDLNRWLKGEPIHARPAGRLERAWKWAKRRPMLAALSALTTVAALIAVGVFTWANVELTAQKTKTGEAEQKTEIAEKTAREEKTRTKAAVETADAESYRANIKAAFDAWENKDDFAVARSLRKCPAALRDWEWYFLDNAIPRSRLTLNGHTAQVHSVAFHPDGNQLASADDDGTVKIWDTKTGKQLHSWKMGGKGVQRLVYSRDGSQFALASKGRVTIHSAKTGTKLRTVEGDNPVFLPDGRCLVAQKSGKLIKLVDAESGKEAFTLPTYTNPYVHIPGSARGRATAASYQIAAASLNGSRLALFADTKPGKMIRILDLPSGRDVTVDLSKNGSGWKLSLGDITGWALSNLGESLAVAKHNIVQGYRPNQLEVWNAAGKSKPVLFPGNDKGCSCMAFDQSGKYLVTGGNDHKVMLWAIKTSTQTARHVYSEHTSRIADVAFSPDGKQIASASGDKTVKLWSTSQSRQTEDMPQQPDLPTHIAFSRDAKRVAIGYGDGVVCVRVFADEPSEDIILQDKSRETRNGLDDLRVTVELDHGAAFPRFDNSGNRIATVMEDQAQLDWNLKTNRKAGVRPPKQNWTERFKDIAYSPDGKRMAVVLDRYLSAGNRPGTMLVVNGKDGLQVLNVEDRQVLATGRGFDGPFLCIAYGPDGSQFVTGGDKTVNLWDAKSGRHLRAMTGHTDSVHAVTFSPDGESIASGSEDRTVRLWNTGDGKLIKEFIGHEKSVNAVAFSPTGTRLATGASDESVRLWDVKTGKELIAFDRLRVPIAGIAFGPDGRRLVVSFRAGGGQVSPSIPSVRIYDARKAYRPDLSAAVRPPVLAAKDKEKEPEAPANPPRFAKEFTVPQIEMEFVPIQAGTFVMGSPESEPKRVKNERQHQVTLTQRFWMGKFEVTQQQYESIMGSNPSQLRNSYGGRVGGVQEVTRWQYRPVERVSWQDAVTFCQKLTDQERKAGRLPKGYVYRLPTEAEWEYACRAGTKTTYNIGNQQIENAAVIGGNAVQTEEVGSRNPNAWGLFDMHGNVLEWCHDRFGEYPAGDATDPSGPTTGDQRIVRGGSHSFSVSYGRAAARSIVTEVSRMPVIGFRTVLAPAIK